MPAELPCKHMVTEKGKCIDCGEPCENPKWTMENLRQQYERPEMGFVNIYLNDLGNIPAICELAKNTWEEYDRRATYNEDPNRPQVPRLRMIGGRLMRLPFHQI